MMKRYMISALALCVGAISAGAQTVGVFNNSVSWQGNPDASVNAVQTPGSATFSNGAYALMGSGNDIWDNYDEGFYLYNERNGSVSISGQFLWDFPGPNEWSKVGVMIRDNPTLSESKHYTAIVRGAQFGDQVEAQMRLTEGGSSTGKTFQDDLGNNVEATGQGIWLRVSRVARDGNDLFVAEYSLDGSNWIIQDTREFDMADPIAVGLAITSHEDNDLLVEATAQNVQIGDPQFLLVNRSITPSAFETQTTFDVTLNIFNPSSTARTITIEEQIPFRYTASAVSNGGTATGEIIRWNYSAPPGASSITYKAQSPATPDESPEWDGTANGGTITGANSAFLLFGAIKDNMISSPFINRAVTLDGQMTQGEWDGAATWSFVPDDRVTPGVKLSDPAMDINTNQVTGYTFHDASNIYVALDVLDPILDFGTTGEPWQHDSTEIYFDLNLSRSSPHESGPQGFQATVVGDGSRRGGDVAPPTQTALPGGGHSWTDGTVWNAAARPKAAGNGYIVEYQVFKSNIVPPDRTLVGFDVLMNGSDAPGNDEREHKWGWFQMTPDGTVAEYWNNEQGWGLMELVGGPTSVYDWSTF